MLPMLLPVVNPTRPHALAPARYLVLDIETAEPPEAAIRRAMKQWKPPANIRDREKIKSRRQLALENLRARAALLDDAPIISLACKTDRVAIVFDGMPDGPRALDHWQVVNAGNERRLLQSFRDWAEACTDPETILVGHNLGGFDLGKIRLACLRHRIGLPRILAPPLPSARCQPQPTFDTMWEWSKYFTVQHRQDPGNSWRSVKDVAVHLGIPNHSKLVEGGRIPKLYASGDYAAILAHNAADVLVEQEIFLRMTGVAPWPE